MPPPPLPVHVNGKRKIVYIDDDSNHEIRELHHQANGRHANGRGRSCPSMIIKCESSNIPDAKPDIPIPILPLPLPSKRFKKSRISRAVLIRAERLPVFALPPLLTIDDLVKQVFSHQSLLERIRGRFEEPADKPAKHYEKLEHVGDRVLGMIVTTWLHETRPRLTCGSATVSIFLICLCRS